MPIRSFAAVLAVLVVFAAAPADAHAQASAAQAPGAQVTGAVGFDWGTTRAAIVAQRGAASMEQPDAEGVAAMVYDDRVLGREMVAMFFVHPQMGLMRGGYMAPVENAADCGIVLRLLDNVVSRRYPRLEAQERTVGDVGSDACAAALASRGGYMKVWTDPANHARIMLMILPGADGPMLTYSTAEADAWERRKNDARF
ncbi:hypothetical protein [Longimicrobium sp.]|uniref:hypothetical protein n=1 Tax=Longimicrobium sp. TaxID=2029185 RepID=UPI003B3B0189